MSEASSNTTHWAIGAILLFIGAFVVVALVLVYSQADSVDTSVNINNANPTVDSIYVSDTQNGLSNDFGAGLNLVSGGPQDIHINGVVSDPNGGNDIVQVNVRFFRSSVGGACSNDPNDCYGMTDCTLSANNDTSKKYDCHIDNIAFFTDATDVGGHYAEDIWKSRVVVNDANGGTNNLVSSGASDVEINTLLALEIPDDITWSNITTSNIGSDTNTNVDMTIVQQGNDEADVEVSGTNMTCSGTGIIPYQNIEWSLTDLAYGAGGTNDLTTSAVDTDLNIGYRTDNSNPLTKVLYWGIYVPYGAVGTCTGTNTLAAIAH